LWESIEVPTPFVEVTKKERGISPGERIPKTGKAEKRGISHLAGTEAGGTSW